MINKEIPFSDVTSSDWFYEPVREAYVEGLIAGKSATVFDPNGSVTLAQAITIAARAHAGSRAVFGSGGGQNSYGSYIAYALNNGIIKQGDFKNYDAVATRAEMAYIFANVMPADVSAQVYVNAQTPPDVSVRGKYSREIYLLYRSGILVGNDGTGTFMSDSKVTRAEIAAISLRVNTLLLERTSEMRISLFGVTLRMSEAEAATLLGSVRRVVYSAENVKWHLYGDAEYKSFTMVRFANGYSDLVYTMDKDWKDNLDVIEPVSDKIFRDDFVDIEGNNNTYAKLIAGPSAFLDRSRYSAEGTEVLVFELTNAFRALHNKPPLTWDQRLAKAARTHSADMASNGYFDHVDLNGKDSKDRSISAGYVGKRYAENICGGRMDSMYILKDFVESPSHREIILGPYDDLGVGFVYLEGANYAGYCGQVFGGGNNAKKTS
jgi:uncharacterized protein YkwD